MVTKWEKLHFRRRKGRQSPASAKKRKKKKKPSQHYAGAMVSWGKKHPYKKVQKYNITLSLFCSSISLDAISGLENFFKPFIPPPFPVLLSPAWAELPSVVKCCWRSSSERAGDALHVHQSQRLLWKSPGQRRGAKTGCSGWATIKLAKKSSSFDEKCLPLPLTLLSKQR